MCAVPDQLRRAQQSSAPLLHNEITDGAETGGGGEQWNRWRCGADGGGGWLVSCPIEATQ